jgi:KDO2-lipid IV(A) lauroyltransferase
VVNRYHENGQSVIIALGHYGNWEWGTQVVGSVFTHKLVTFYKPLTNRYVDKFTYKLRAKRNMELASIYEVKFFFRSDKGESKAFFLVSDQSPGNAKKAIWLKFLNQDTACLRGVETYAKLFNLPVIFMDVQRVRRGYYTVGMEVICDKPSETLLGEITEMYMNKLEDIIIRKPENWLWSHRRWKLKR